MSSPAEELGAIVTRLEDAASRLKDDAGPEPRYVRGEDADAPPPAPPPQPIERRRLSEVLAGLERANVEVRRARQRLAEIEARLGREAA